MSVSSRIAIAALLLPLALAADDAPQASGKFKGSRFSFDVTGAYAYWSRSSDEGPLIEVAVSNDGFKTEAFDAFYDPRPVIDTNFTQGCADRPWIHHRDTESTRIHHRGTEHTEASL